MAIALLTEVPYTESALASHTRATNTSRIWRHRWSRDDRCAHSIVFWRCRRRRRCCVCVCRSTISNGRRQTTYTANHVTPSSTMTSILISVQFIQYQRVTDRRKDGRTDGRTDRSAISISRVSISVLTCDKKEKEVRTPRIDIHVYSFCTICNYLTCVSKRHGKSDMYVNAWRSYFFFLFIARQHTDADARYWYSNSVCLSVCPWYAGIVWKRLNISS